MSEQTRPSTLEQLRRAVRDKEGELCELDLMLADYHTERSRLIRELRRLRAQLGDGDETLSSVLKPQAKNRRISESRKGGAES